MSMPANFLIRMRLILSRRLWIESLVALRVAVSSSTPQDRSSRNAHDLAALMEPLQPDANERLLGERQLIGAASLLGRDDRQQQVALMLPP
jgi:hypothetical protein